MQTEEIRTEVCDFTAAEEELPHSFPQKEIHISEYESPEALLDVLLREHWENILNSDYDLILTK